MTIFDGLGVTTETELTLSLVGRDRVRSLNRRFRRVDEVTDVLSFPQYDPATPCAPDQPVLLGDLVICLPLMMDQSRRHRLTVANALAVLLAHGSLHLLGFDHHEPGPTLAMAEVELGLIALLGFQPATALLGRAWVGSTAHATAIWPEGM